MEKNTENRELNLLEMKGLCKLIEENEFTEYNNGVEYDERLTYISVQEDSEDGCKAYFWIREDSPRWSAPAGVINHTVEVDDIILNVEESENGISDVSVSEESDVVLSSDPDLYTELIDVLNEVIGGNDFVHPDADELFENDWSSEEVIDEIESQLHYETYAEVDGTVFPVEDDDLQAFMELHFPDGYEEEAITIYSSHDLALELAENIEFSY